MTVQEVLQKEVFSVKDICVLLGCKTDKAYDFIKAIRSISDTLGWAGHCHKKDYEAWTNRFNTKKESLNDSTPSMTQNLYR